MAESSAGRAGVSKAKTAVADAAAVAQDEARRQFESTREVLMEQGDEAYRRAKSSVLSAAEQQKQRAAESIGGFARTLHDMARNLDGQNQAAPARYTDLAAERLDQAAHLLQEKSVDDLMNDVESFARRQPAMFIGGAFVAGLLLARFLKSSEARTALDEDSTIYGSDDVGVGMSYGAGYGGSAAGSGYGDTNPPGGGI